MTYRFVCALPKAELARHRVMLRSIRTRRSARKQTGERRAPIVGMVSIAGRPADVADRRIPGAWEGDLIIGAHGKSAAATLVERQTRFTVICGLPEGKKAPALADVLSEQMGIVPEVMRTSLTWDQDSVMAEHLLLSTVLNLPAYFAHPRSPWERGTNENTNELIREYLPKGTNITSNQAYLTMIADDLNDRPRASRGVEPLREQFEQLLRASVPSTTRHRPPARPRVLAAYMGLSHPPVISAPRCRAVARFGSPVALGANSIRVPAGVGNRPVCSRLRRSACRRAWSNSNSVI